MDGVGSNNSAGAATEQSAAKTVMVLAATNRPMDLDEALRRRLEKRIYIPLPNEKGLKQLFDINLKGIKLAEDFDVSKLLKKLKGYSGADIANVCREAAMMPMRKKIAEGKLSITEIANSQQGELSDIPICMDDFLHAIKNIQKSVSNDLLQQYADWMKEFGSV
jgi:katanin p60 ATPase-containing subunit A1